MAQKKIVEPVRAGRCLAPLCIFAPGRPDASMMICGLIDTGANHSAIDARLVGPLGLPPRGARVVSAHNNVSTQPTYGAVIDFWLQGFGPAAKVFDVELHIMPQPMIGGTMLIGMDLLKEGQFKLRSNGIWEFAF